MEVKLGDSTFKDFETHNPFTGQVQDADSLPTAVCYENGGPGVGGGVTVSKRSSTTGEYDVQVDATIGNGFETGKVYNLVVTAAVEGVTQKSTILTFVVRAKTVDDAAQAADWTPARAAKVDEITPARLAELDPANIPADVDTLLARLTASRANLLDKLNITGNVAGSVEVMALSNNTLTRLSVPEFFERPDAGSTAFVLDLYVYDLDGSMQDADSTPTITAVNEAGADRSANLSAVTRIGEGHYRVTYTVSSAHLIEQLRFEWTVVVGAKTRLAGHASWVVDTTAVDFTAADRTKLDTIHGKLPSGNIGDATVANQTAILAALAALNDLSSAEVQTAADAALQAKGYTAARAALLDGLRDADDAILGRVLRSLVNRARHVEISGESYWIIWKAGAAGTVGVDELFRMKTFAADAATKATVSGLAPTHRNEAVFP